MAIRFTEFEIQAEAYFRLRMVFSSVRGEYRFKDKNDRTHIFDLVILGKKNEPIIIIEVKRALRKRTTSNQHIRYANAANCPVIYVQGMEEAKDVIWLVRNKMKIIYG